MQNQLYFYVCAEIQQESYFDFPWNYQNMKPKFITSILSRNHKNLNDIVSEEKRRHVLTESQTEQILRRLSIPQGRHFTSEIFWNRKWSYNSL